MLPEGLAMVVYFPGILLNYEETPYTGYRDLTEMWHEEASQLGNQEIEEINHRLKELSELLIGASVVSIIVTQGVAIFAGIFYLIAGIMCLARKPQEIIEE